MSQTTRRIVRRILDDFQFKKTFDFRTAVPADLCIKRLEDIPFTDGKHHYTVETEPQESGVDFLMWTGNHYQREPHQARVVGAGHVRQDGREIWVTGYTKIGLRRMLMWSILTLILGFWTFGVFTAPYYWLAYVCFTAGIPLVAPIYLFWKTRRERNQMIKDIQHAIAPRAGDQLAGIARLILNDDILESQDQPSQNQVQQRRG